VQGGADGPGACAEDRSACQERSDIGDRDARHADDPSHGDHRDGEDLACEVFSRPVRPEDGVHRLFHGAEDRRRQPHEADDAGPPEDALLLLDSAELFDEVAGEVGVDVADRRDQILLDMRVGAEDLAGHDDRENDQRKHGKDGVKGDRGGLVDIPVLLEIGDGIGQEIPGGCRAEMETLAPVRRLQPGGIGGTVCVSFHDSARLARSKRRLAQPSRGPPAVVHRELGGAPPPAGTGLVNLPDVNCMSAAFLR